MKSSVYKCAAVGLITLMAVFAAAAQTKGNLFRGSVGDKKVAMELKRDGGSLSGTYYYLKSGAANKLTLKGTIAADGSFKMQETDASGKQTGEFAGKWKESDYESGIALEGTWVKPGQTDNNTGFYAWEQMIDFVKTQITTREIKESLKVKKAEISAEYPELSGSANAAGFNSAAKAAVLKAIGVFKKDLSTMTAADLKLMSANGMGSYIDVGYNVEYADDDLISVNFSTDYFMGGAHPSHDTFTLTYDLKSGKELTLASLFKPGSKYLNTIATLSVADLKARKDPDSGESLGLLSDGVFVDGAKPTAANYHNWNITKKGLMFTFVQYQVASYAEGPQTVIVPYAKLKPMAAANGPLAKWMK